jgi:hypothetical protein
MTKKIFLLLIFATFLMGSFCFAQRELELEYPGLGVPGVETPTTTRTVLTEFVRYVFTLAIALAGLLAFGALIYGGIRYLTSAGDPTKMSDGKNQAMAGFLGLIILLSSYLILNTIDPQLVLKETPAIESLEKGIYAYVKAGCVDDPEDSFDDPVSISQASPDLSIVLPRKANGIPQSLQCIKFRSGKEELTVKVCSGTNFGEPCTPYEGEVGEIKNVTGQSIRMDYHLPGVYLYASDNCAGDDYKIYQSSSATLPEFDNKTKSIKFIYDDKDPDTEEYGIKYAVILHEKENFMGGCLLVEPTVNGECFSLSGGSTKNPSSFNSFSLGTNNVFAAGVCDTVVDGHDGSWWCGNEYLETKMAGEPKCDGVNRCLDDDTLIRFGCWLLLGMPLGGATCLCDEGNSYTEDCEKGEECIEIGDWEAQCVETGEEEEEEPPLTILTPPFAGVSSITVYLKPVGEPIGQGVRFWGDKNYTNEKDEYVLPSIATSPYEDDTKVSNIEEEQEGSDNKITSMEIDGHYVALLFDKENYQGDCEVFMASCPDFRSHRIGQCGWLGRSDCLSSFIIKARK